MEHIKPIIPKKWLLPKKATTMTSAIQPMEQPEGCGELLKLYEKVLDDIYKRLYGKIAMEKYFSDMGTFGQAEIPSQTVQQFWIDEFSTMEKKGDV